MEKSHKLSFYEELAKLKSNGLFTVPRNLEDPQGPSIQIDGHRVINLASNDYLGMANHPSVKAAAAAAIESWGVGSAAARNIVGTMSPHLDLEQRIAQFKGTESAILVSSGYAANIGTIPAIAGEEDTILSDELNHGSLIDGCRLSKAKRLIYLHRDIGSLEKLLKQCRSSKGIIVITDSVFSMDGDIAPLAEIFNLVDQYGACLYVDDAHGTGVLGNRGRGAVEHFSLHGKIDVEMGTLSKALGSFGGFIAGSSDLCNWLRQRKRSYILSTSPPPSICAAAMAAIDVIENYPQLVTRLWSNAEEFRSGLQEMGFNTGTSETPIIPVIIGEATLAIEMSRRLFEEGVFAQSIVYPTVSKGNARLRTIVTAAHIPAELDQALSAFRKVGRRLSII